MPFDRDLSQELHPSVVPIPAAPGTCIIFTEAMSAACASLRDLRALVSLTCVAIHFRTHGTLPWTYPDHGRTTLFYKCPPRIPSSRG